MSYDLRRLRLHDLSERIPKFHRYRTTRFGPRAALAVTRAGNRMLRPALASAHAQAPPTPIPIRAALIRAERAIARAWSMQNVAT